MKLKLKKACKDFDIYHWSLLALFLLISLVAWNAINQRDAAIRETERNRDAYFRWLTNIQFAPLPPERLRQ
jgi:hypothetical protein